MLSSTSHSYSNNKKNARIVIDFSWCWRGSRRGKDCAIVIGVRDGLRANSSAKDREDKKKDKRFIFFGGEERGAIWREEPRQSMDRARSLTDRQFGEITCTIFDGQTSQPPPHQGRLPTTTLQATYNPPSNSNITMVMVCIGIPRYSSHQTS